MKSLPAVIGLSICLATCFTSRGQIDVTSPVDDNVKPLIPEADRYNGRVFLERAGKLVRPSDTVDYQIVVNDVMFRRGDMYMYCDSAHFYDTTSSLEAFGNVRMEQGDTLFVYGDRLVFTDSTQLAVLYAETSDHVRLINRDVTLLTDVFYYDMGIELGYYETGGELIDNRNRLVSVYGEYAPPTKDAVFRDDVFLTSLSKTDTLKIWSEDLRYNTDTHIAELVAPSTVVSKDGTIFTDMGQYNTETTVADLYERSLVVTSTGRTLVGDTIFYDHALGYGEAFGNVILTDTINKSRLKGDYGFYNELSDSAIVTGHALAVDYSSPDSLSLHGDTIKTYRVITKNYVPVDTGAQVPDTVTVILSMQDSLPVIPDYLPSEETITTDSLSTETSASDSLEVEMPVADSLAVEIEAVDTIARDSFLDNFKEVADTTHHIVAYPNVRFYRSDLQGVCDSMTYVQKDSLIHLNRDPIIWSGARQIFGNVILVHVNDSTADKVTLPDRGFMAEMIEEGFYNQMSGREMIATLDNGQLRHLDVNGNVLIVFFPMNEEDSTYTKVANAESSFLAADFKNQTIERMKMWSQSTEKITPLYLAKKSIFFLPDFKWEAWRRPKGHDDLLSQPVNPAKEQEPAQQPAPLDQSSPMIPPDMSDKPTESLNTSDNDNEPTN